MSASRQRNDFFKMWESVKADTQVGLDEIDHLLYVSIAYCGAILLY